MKKLFLSLFVAGTLTFALQSCEKDDNDDDNNDTNTYDCTECGTYNTEATGDMKIGPLGSIDIDTVWTDTNKVALPAEFIQTSSGDFELSVNLSSITSLITEDIVVQGDYNTTTKLFTVQDFEYSVLGAVPVVVNGNVDFSTAGTAVGSLALEQGAGATVPVDGQLDFEGTK